MRALALFDDCTISAVEIWKLFWGVSASGCTILHSPLLVNWTLNAAHVDGKLASLARSKIAAVL